MRDPNVSSKSSTELEITDSMDPSSSSKPKVWPYLIILLVFFYVLSFATQMIANRQWLLTYVCRLEGAAPNTTNNTLIWEECTKNKIVHAKTARWDMANSLASNIPAIISIPILGSLSDRIGRRPIIFLPLVYVLCVPGTTLEANDKLRLFRTSIIDLSSTLLVTEFEASLWILVATKFTSGIFGGWGILFVVVHAYLADLVPADNRTAAYMYLEATVISGFVIGPVIGGFLSRWFDSGVIGVIQVSLGIRVIGFSFFLLFIKESRSAASLAEAQKRLTVESMALQSISSSFSIFFEKQSWNRAILLVVIFSIGIHYGAASCFFLWTAFKFKWDAYHHGIYQLTLSASRLAWMSLLSLKWFSRSTRGEVWLLQTSLFVMFGSYVIIGTVAESWIVFAMAGVHGLVILAKPTVLGLLSRSVSPSQQGTLFSGLQVTQQIGLFAASLLFPNIWAVTVGTVYSSTFLFVEAGAMLLSCLLLFFLSARELDNSQAKMQDEEVSVFPGGIAEKKDKDFDQIHVQVVQKSAETETEETTKPHNS